MTQQQSFKPDLTKFCRDIKEIEKGVDFILSHLEEPLIFPRKISTQKSQNKQFSVRNKEDIFMSFIDSKLVDCRINAFPILKDGATWIPDFLFIDLDIADFNFNKRSLKLSLNKILKNIREKLDKNAFPTVLWSGNGYHIILPVFCPRELERIQEFQGFDKPSEEFLRFAKDFLSNNKADKANNPSFRSCLLRIPNSLNSKCLTREYATFENSKVKIIQEWNGYRPPIKEILYDFRRYLIQKKINDYNYKQKYIINKNRRNTTHHCFINQNKPYFYTWIEKLLNTPITDYRKNTVSLILAPYLINVKKLSYSESFEIINKWLSLCNNLKYLDQRFDDRIKRSLKTAIDKKALLS